MKIQIATWGNGLALRLPLEIARRMGVQAGDTIDAQITVDGGLTLRPFGGGEQPLPPSWKWSDRKCRSVHR